MIVLQSSFSGVGSLLDRIVHAISPQVALGASGSVIMMAQWTPCIAESTQMQGHRKRETALGVARTSRENTPQRARRVRREVYQAS